MRTTTDTSFQVDLPFNLVQSIRLIHALLETDYDVRIPERHVPKAQNLRDVFGLTVKAGGKEMPSLPGLEIKHEGLPQTRIGAIERPLIFAQGMTSRCRSLWESTRSVRVCFAGRLHQERREVLRRWLRRQFPGKDTFDLPEQTAVDRRVELRKRVKRYAKRILRGPFRSLLKYIRVPSIERCKRWEGIVFMTSDRGWRHPTKAWDPAYFQLLSDSKFVLCPDGKFVWTYRFFEAALCGAIPIVQNRCSLYDGFRYYAMDERIDTIEWSQNDAVHNFNVCCERLTIPRDQLNAEVERLLRSV